MSFVYFVVVLLVTYLYPYLFAFYCVNTFILKFVLFMTENFPVLFPINNKGKS